MGVLSVHLEASVNGEVGRSLYLSVGELIVRECRLTASQFTTPRMRGGRSPKERKRRCVNCCVERNRFAVVGKQQLNG